MSRRGRDQRTIAEAPEPAGNAESVPRHIGEARSYDGFADLIKTRIAELNLANETVDAVAGLPLRYSQKILSLNPAKKFGRDTLGPLLSTLCLKVILAIDTDEQERWERIVKDRLEARKQAPAGQAKAPRARNANWPMPTGKTRRNKGFRLTPETAKLARQHGLLLMSPAQRKRAARYAARCRWAKVRAAKKIAKQQAARALPQNEHEPKG